MIRPTQDQVEAAQAFVAKHADHEPSNEVGREVKLHAETLAAEVAVLRAEKLDCQQLHTPVEVARLRGIEQRVQTLIFSGAKAFTAETLRDALRGPR